MNAHQHRTVKWSSLKKHGVSASAHLGYAHTVVVSSAKSMCSQRAARYDALNNKEISGKLNLQSDMNPVSDVDVK